MTPDARPTPDLPDSSDLIAGLADGTLVVGTLSGFEVAGVVKELMRRNAELERLEQELGRALRSITVERLTNRWGNPMPKWQAEEQADARIADIHKAAKLDGRNGG